jgi:glutamate-1-semialdehyde 2,1-aminomutase
MGLQGKETKAWFDRAKQVLVAGVSSSFRYWGEEDTPVFERGQGAYLYDMDGRRYIDYMLGFGPVLLGHGHSHVVQAVAAAAAEGVSFAATQRREIEAAEKVVAAVPWVERLRFTNTGTEATMHAIRLARAHTGREIVVKFEGAYHGAHDYLMFSTAGAPPSKLGSRRSPVPWQQSSGIPEVIRSLIRVIPFNDLEAVERLFRSEGHRVAALIVEPTLGNTFGILPEPGFLEGLRRVCNDYETVLIFDEVKTGFRMGPAGAAGHFHVTPDLATYAKSLGNGFPVAAIAGAGEVLRGWEGGGAFQAGTYSGNSVSAAAASATLDVLTTGEPYRRIDEVGRALMEGFAKVLAEAGVPGHVVGHPSLFGLFLADSPPREFRDLARHDADLYARVAYGMVRRGVMMVDEAVEPFFTSAAHSDEDVALTLSAFDEALREALG